MDLEYVRISDVTEQDNLSIDIALSHDFRPLPFPLGYIEVGAKARSSEEQFSTAVRGKFYGEWFPSFKQWSDDIAADSTGRRHKKGPQRRLHRRR